VILSHSYRSTPAILDLATMINRGDTAGALGFLSGGDEGSPVSIDTTTGSEPIEEWIRSQLTEPSVDEAYRLLANPPEGAEYSPDVTAAITTVLFNATMLVLAHEGPRGRKAINRLAAAGLRRKLHNPPGDRFFHGMPIILGSNHHELDLYNGDIGIVLHTKNEGTKVFFPRGDRLHPVSLDRLIDPEPAFALTVHKSQGSEFNAVLLVLPEHESPLLSRQIIYTGITRAKKYLKILGSTSILAAAINRVEKREGGLQLS
ncbi:MAG: ATP-binding domain-containing protein, partial [Chitinispirillaceae bacterium]|nr:ATP-binding domain-containing protein [Chitinispirillaceae bacterium]